jgi:hypothetical protein
MKKKRKRSKQNDSIGGHGSKQKKISLLELSEDKQLAMRTALQCRLATSTQSVFNLFNLRKQKQQTLFALKLLCKQTIALFDLNPMQRRSHSLHLARAAAEVGVGGAMGRDIGEMICDLMMMSDQYVSVFSPSAEPTRIPEPLLPPISEQYGTTTPSSKLKSRGLRLSSQSMLQEESHRSFAPSVQLTRDIISDSLLPNSRPSLAPNRGLDPCAQLVCKPVEVIGSVARSLLRDHRRASQYLIFVCLRNTSRSPSPFPLALASLFLFTRNPLCHLSLQAESIISPESHLSYLRFKQTSASSLHCSSMIPKTRCRMLSSTIAELAPGSVAIVTGILTISSPSSPPPLPESIETSNPADYTAQSQAIQRIILLNGGPQNSPPSVLVALSTLIHLRIQFSERVPSSSSTSTTPRVQLEESVPISDRFATLRPHLSFCGILPIPPEVHCPFDRSQYLQECERSFAPLAVVPLYCEGRGWEGEEEGTALWGHLNEILSRVPDPTITLHGFLSSPRSYHLPSPLSDDQDLDKIKEILSAHSSSSSLIMPQPLLLELSLRSLDGPLLSLSQERGQGQHHLLHIFLSPATRSHWESNSFLSSLRYDLLAQHCNPHTTLTSAKFTKGAVGRLLRPMELAVQSLLLSIKHTAVAWREMNLLKSQSHRGAGASERRGRDPSEGRLYLGSRLFTTNPQLWEDILQSQSDCDEAMIAYLLALQQFLR